MKMHLSFYFLFFFFYLFSQNYEVKKIETNYKKTKVEYIVLSKTGEQWKKKTIFFFCQGSLAQPILKKEKNAVYPILPFDENIILEKFHIIIVNKPGIPIEESTENLTSNYSYPKSGLPSKTYILNNNLDYYYKRNNFIITENLGKSWVDPKQIVAVGHSEGSYIALKMAKSNSKITHLIYSGGNPLGRMMSIINQDRKNPKQKESWVKEDLEMWKEIVNNKNVKETYKENTSYYSFSLSQNFTGDLLGLKIPVLVTYGTQDQNGIFNDYLNVLTIKEGKHNFTFKTYFNCDHNFFPIDENFNPDYEIDNWTEVGKYWYNWLTDIKETK